MSEILILILSELPRHGDYNLRLSVMREILILILVRQYGDYDLRLSVMSETPQGGNGNQGQTLSIGRQCSDHLRSYLISPLCSFLFLTYIHVFPSSILSYFLLTYLSWLANIDVAKGTTDQDLCTLT